MNARQSNAYVLSVLLHGTVAVLVLLLAYTASQSSLNAPKVFEMVAGPGDNYAATEAPALGMAGGIKVSIPAPPPAPAPIEPAPMEAAPPAPVPPAKAVPAKTAPAKTTPVKADAVPNFTKSEARAATRLKNHLAAIYKAEQKKKESYEQFLKEQSGKTAARAPAPGKAPKVDAEGIASGVTGGSISNKTGGAGGRALSREARDARDAYYAMLKARLVENEYAGLPGESENLEARVEFFIAADGSISRMRLLRSSGSPSFDGYVREAFSRIHMPPPPEGAGGICELKLTPKDHDAE